MKAKKSLSITVKALLLNLVLPLLLFLTICFVMYRNQYASLYEEHKIE